MSQPDDRHDTDAPATLKDPEKPRLAEFDLNEFLREDDDGRWSRCQVSDFDDGT